MGYIDWSDFVAQIDNPFLFLMLVNTSQQRKGITMAVESRFVVIRNGVEVETFMDKKTADEYDKMLDMADSLVSVLEQSPLDLKEQLIEDLSVFMAKNREDILIALQAKKPKPVQPTQVKSAAKAKDKAVISPELVEEIEKPKPVKAKATKPRASKKTVAEKE